ncbi:hypothetical protein GE09DRAFT_393004 [Coniochaeta sp. 2T2.1]|nr:hypothetical protein GE09DRAFT_393004 [Coniochaeta sp. 2T2.1]
MASAPGSPTFVPSSRAYQVSRRLDPRSMMWNPEPVGIPGTRKARPRSVCFARLFSTVTVMAEPRLYNVAIQAFRCRLSKLSRLLLTSLLLQWNLYGSLDIDITATMAITIPATEVARFWKVWPKRKSRKERRHIDNTATLHLVAHPMLSPGYKMHYLLTFSATSLRSSTNALAKKGQSLVDMVDGALVIAPSSHQLCRIPGTPHTDETRANSQ